MAPPAKYEWLVPAPDLYYFRNTTVGQYCFHQQNILILTPLILTPTDLSQALYALNLTGIILPTKTMR